MKSLKCKRGTRHGGTCRYAWNVQGDTQAPTYSLGSAHYHVSTFVQQSDGIASMICVPHAAHSSYSWDDGRPIKKYREKERLYPKLTGVIGRQLDRWKEIYGENGDNCRIRGTETKSEGGSRSNQYQSIKRFILDRFPFRVFPQQFSIYLHRRNEFSRRKTSFSSSFILFSYPPRCWNVSSSRPSLLNHRQTNH